MSPTTYGHFDDAAREYVITRPDTPLPWINYLGSDDYVGIISNTAGGYAFHRDARLRRLTRYRYNSCPLDSDGRHIYVKDGDDVWNPGWKPTRTPLDGYECRHGLGYTRIRGERNGLTVEACYFVPVGADLEIWDVRVRNDSPDTRSVSLFGCVEWCLWDAMDDMTNFQRNLSIGEVEVADGVVFHTTEYRERRDHFAFFDCTAPTAGFDTSRDAFIGVHEGPDRPRAVAAGRCTGSVAHGWAPIAAHQVDLELAPGERRRFQFRLGYCENPKDQKFTSDGRLNMAPYTQAVAAFDSDSRVDAAFASLADAWADRLDAYQARLDDPRVERMVNTWNQYQCMITFLMSRSASGYESGIGRGMGYRDSNQDILGMVHLAPDRCRERLCDLAATQMSDGSCFHQYQPLTKKGNADIGGGFNDDPLWLVLAVGAYIRETGDTSILDEPVGYADDDPPGAGGATIGDHLELSLRYTESNLGPHGLPLIGHADWNDCLNLNCFSDTPGESFQTAGDVEGSDAESVMIAGLYAAACAEMADLCDHLGEADRAEELRDRRRSMADTIERSAWDGAWFRRAYDADGKPLGSKDCDEGQIFIEPQGWCVLGGVGVDNGKARAALDSVRQRLATDHGIVLQQPAYAAYDRAKGEITSYPPGYKENAGIFAHSNTWIQIAETILGDGDQAFAYFRSICPAFVEDHDLYRAEPYVYAQMIAGRDAPNHGEAKNSWLTGTAGWSFVAISQHILGVRPDYAGLRIDPCVPREWRSFSITRRFRGTRYEITVHNPDGVSRGVGAIEVDGTPIDGPVVPAASGSDTVRVDVRLAAAAMERSSA